MLPANADFEILLDAATLRHAHRHQLTHSADIQTLERIAMQNFLTQVVRQERVDVVSTVTKRHLRQVVGAETEEVRMLGDLISRQRQIGRASCRERV